MRVHFWQLYCVKGLGVSTAVKKWVKECSDEREKAFKEPLFIVAVIRQK